MWHHHTIRRCKHDNLWVRIQTFWNKAKTLKWDLNFFSMLFHTLARFYIQCSCCSEAGADPRGMIGAIAPRKTSKSDIIYSPWFCTIRKKAFAFAIRVQVFVHCFVTVVLWSILHLSYSNEPAMRLDYQILLKSLPQPYWPDPPQFSCFM